MKRCAIYGSSGCGRGVMPLVRRQLQLLLQSAVDLVFVDDKPFCSMLNRYRVLTCTQWLEEPASSPYLNVAIANSQ